MDLLVLFLILTGLILLNGVFVVAEFAIAGVPRTVIERRAAQGHRVARVVHRILQDPRQQDRYIATAQLGITFASLGLGMYGEHALARWLAVWFEALPVGQWIAAHAVASVASLAVLTYFHIVVGEMVAKSLALQQAERAALLVTPVMLWVKALLYPLVLGLNGVGNLFLKLFGIDRQRRNSEQYHTAEELQFIVRESLEGGLLHPESGRVLRELLEFADLTAGEVMVPRVRVAGIPLGATADELAGVFRSSPHTRYPVYRQDLDHVVGVVHVKDILRLVINGGALTEDVVRPIPYVPEAAHLDTVLTVMREQHTQLVVVLDEHGGTAGFLTIEDVFQEVVGEIEEQDSESADVYRDADGNLHVAGTVRIDEVGELFDRTLEHEEVDTVSGLVLTLLERPPAVGDTVTYDGVTFEVSAVEGHGVKECIVVPVPQAADV